MAQQTPWDPAAGSAPPPPPTPPAPPAPPIPPGPPAERYNRRGGIGAGIILIALGIIFLVGQFVPGLSWWQMWPLIIVVIGCIQLVTPDRRDGWGVSRVMDGIGTVLVGLVLLGNTTGYISWGVWWNLLLLWPVLLVALGLAIVGKALGQTWIRALSPVVIWIALAYAVSISLTGQGGYQAVTPLVWTQQGQSFTVSEPLNGATKAKLTFDGGAADITIGGTTSDLINAHGTSPFGTPKLVVNRVGDSADVSMAMNDAHGVAVGPGLTGAKIDVGLSDSVVWDATLNTGATNVVADLSPVKLSALTVKTGVSSADLKLGVLTSSTPTGGGAKTPVVIKAGVSSVVVRIPRNTEARVRASNGLSSLDVSSDLTKQADGSYQTAGYSTTGIGYDIQIESGVGSVTVRTY